MTEVKVPGNLWSASDDSVLKVILRGTNAYKLPYEEFINALRDNGIFVNNDISDVHVNISETPRKRTVYGKLKFKHRQTFDIVYLDSIVTFILIDPHDTRLEITLLHMPYQTTPAAIRHIFNVLNKDWHVSDVKHSPGNQMRNDRWQCLLECENKEQIPHSFILPKMGVEGENLKIKVRLRGRNPPCYICDDTSHTPDHCPSKRPPSPPARPRAASATTPPPAATLQHTHVSAPSSDSSSQHDQPTDWEKVLRNRPCYIKECVLKCLSEIEPTEDINIETVVNGLSDTKTVKELKLAKCCTKAKDEKLVPSFTSQLSIGIKPSDCNASINEIEAKTAILKIFTHLFASSGVNQKDIEIMKDFVYGKSSRKRFFYWLCQWANFYETKKKADSNEIVIREKETK